MQFYSSNLKEVAHFGPLAQPRLLLPRSVAWSDYDNDGDLDLTLLGTTGAANLTRIYRNTGGVFADAGANLPPNAEGGVSWGDYDGDGDLDLLMSGYDGTSRFLRVYRNTAGTFADIGAGMTGVSSSKAEWGDYDNNGDLDVVAAGYQDSGTGLTRLYVNESGTFADSGSLLPGLYYGSVAFADYDNDGDLDLALSGYNGSALGALYRNDGAPANVRPGVPGNLAGVRSGNRSR